MPRASILITVYNGEKDIERAIIGALSQSLKDYEVVVVNDGSTDGTSSILESWASHHRELRLVQSAHIGRAKALNVGLAHCNSPYVAINDCDDVSMPGRLEAQARYLDEHPRAVLVAGWARIRTEDGESLGKRKMPTDDRSLRWRLAIGNPFVHSTVMYRKSGLERVGGFDETLTAAEDYDAIERLARVGQLACVPTVVAVHQKSERQFFTSRMPRRVRWKVPGEVAIRAALHHAWWLLPVSLGVYGVTRLRMRGFMVDRMYEIHGRIVRR